MQWALNNVPCECTMETWIELEGNVAKVKARLNNERSDRTQYRAFDQELPAVYTNGTWYKLFTYDGTEPFTGAPLRQVHNAGPPWTHWRATENWAALVNDTGIGLGVFHAGVYTFTGGFHGKPNTGGPKDGSTGYITPIHKEILDHNIRYSYEYRLIGGTLEQIRAYVYAHRPEARPHYVFEADRQHWRYVNASDNGMPLNGKLHVRLEKSDPQLIGPPEFWQAADVGALYITAAYHTKSKQSRLYWSTPDKGFEDELSIGFSVSNDGQFHTYKLTPNWSGTVTSLRLDPVSAGSAGEFIELKSISYRP
jgi:hypothetical protein